VAAELDDTIDLAITKVLSLKLANTMQMQIIIVDNDATACFDQMIKPQTIWHVHNMEPIPSTYSSMHKHNKN